METISEDVVIVGAGIAGLATAIALKRVGVRALVLERSPELRAQGAAVNLSPNAWLALQALGVAHKLTSIYPPLDMAHITDMVTGATTDKPFTAVDRTGMGVRPVHRKLLVETLAEELPADTIRFSSKVGAIETQQLDNSSAIAVLHLEDGTITKAKVLIGCDGVHSVVARWLGLMEPVYSGRYAVLGISKFPQGHGFNHDLHEIYGKAQRAGCAPLSDKEVFWYLTFKCSTGKEMARDREMIQKVVIEETKDFPPRFLDVIKTTDLDTLYWLPLMLRVPWNIIFRQASKGVITVVGDAMHPMTPDLGQGAGSALEDAVVLGRHIGDSFLRKGGIVAGEMEGALDRYVKERRWRVAGLIMGAYVSGWSHQGGSRWMRFLRDFIAYNILFRLTTGIMNFDCGKLPTASSNAEKDKQA